MRDVAVDNGESANLVPMKDKELRLGHLGPKPKRLVLLVGTAADLVNPCAGFPDGRNQRFAWFELRYGMCEPL